MSNFSAPLLGFPIGTTYVTAGYVYANVTAGSARRIQVYEYEFGQIGGYSSTDSPVEWDVSRFTSTALATGTLVVPQPLDPADSSPLSTYYNVALGEPSYVLAASGLSIKKWAINQRGSYRWRALDDGDNIVVPATAMNGVGIRARSITSGYTASVVGNLNFIER